MVFMYYPKAVFLMKEIGDESFLKEIEGRHPSIVWILMFFVANSKASDSILQRFKKASDISNGMVQLGIINVSRYPSFEKRYNITKYPYFRIYYDGGDVQFSGPFKPDGFISAAASHIMDYTQKATILWKNQSKSHPCAIFFTNGKVPHYWKAISAHYARFPIRIGVSDDKDVFETFSVSEYPAIVFANEGNVSFYEGEYDFVSLKNAIDRFFPNRIGNLYISNEGYIYHQISSFSQLCTSKKNCIIFISKEITKEIDDLRSNLIKDKFITLYANEQMPYNFMNQTEGVWIYCPRKEGFIYVSDHKDIGIMLDRIRDGGAPWQKKNFLLGIPEENVPEKKVNKKKQKNKKDKGEKDL